jgi:hypothetical protein
MDLARMEAILAQGREMHKDVHSLISQLMNKTMLSLSAFIYVICRKAFNTIIE